MITNNLIQDKPNGRNIVTVAEVQSYIKNNTSSLTGFIQTCISDVSQTFESFCNTGLKLNTYTGYYPTPIDKKIWVNNVPIISLSAVQYRTSPLYSYTDYSSDLETSVIVGNSYIQLYNLNYYPVSFSDPYTFKIEYTAGYSECPFDLKKICLEAVSEMIDESKQGNSLLGKSSTNINSGAGGGSENYYQLTTRHLAILDKYKKTII